MTYDTDSNTATVLCINASELVALLESGKITKQVVARVVEYFASLGVKRSMLAKQMGVTHYYLNHVICGTHKITDAFCWRLIKAMTQNVSASGDRIRPTTVAQRQAGLVRAQKPTPKTLIAMLKEPKIGTSDLHAILAHFDSQGVKSAEFARRVDITYGYLLTLMFEGRRVTKTVSRRVQRLLAESLGLAVAPPPAGRGNDTREARLTGEHGTLAWLVEHYIASHELAKGSRRNLRVSADCFRLFLGREPIIDKDFTREVLNAFVASVTERFKPATASGHRRRVLAFWRHAYDEGLLTTFPVRIRTIKQPRANPDSWELAQVAAIIAEARKVRGIFRSPRSYGISKRGYMTSLLLLLYESGMRLGDAMLLEWSSFRGKSVCWSQHKTGKPMVRPLSPELMTLIQQTFPVERRLIFGGILSYNLLRKYFVRICKAAGTRGTFRKLRRTSGTLVELNAPGHGHRHLGNTQSVFDAHYADKAFIEADAPTPPRLTPPGPLQPESASERDADAGHDATRQIG